MHKTEAEQIFDFLVSKNIWPHFKKRGYKKSGNNIRYYDNSGWGKIVNFQKSMFYNKEHIHFTINTGLYLSEAEQFHCGTQSFEKFHESMCMVRQRIGYLSDAKKDLWFDIDNNVNKEAFIQTIEGYVANYIIPYLDDINSKDDIIKFFLKGHKSEYIAAQIETLFANGHEELAKQQLQKELEKATNSYFLETLRKISERYED
jgi:hypothetical protein